MKTMKRREVIRDGVRCGVLTGLVGIGAVLVSREEKFVCSDRCGGCAKYRNGQCGLGLK